MWRLDWRGLGENGHMSVWPSVCALHLQLPLHCQLHPNTNEKLKKLGERSIYWQWRSTKLLGAWVVGAGPEDLGLTPGLGRSPEEGNGYPLQYSGLENSMERQARCATVNGVPKGQT